MPSPWHVPRNRTASGDIGHAVTLDDPDMKAFQQEDATGMDSPRDAIFILTIAFPLLPFVFSCLPNSW